VFKFHEPLDRRREIAPNNCCLMSEKWFMTIPSGATPLLATYSASTPLCQNLRHHLAAADQRHGRPKLT
jgi:hypothetical protein